MIKFYTQLGGIIKNFGGDRFFLTQSQSSRFILISPCQFYYLLDKGGYVFGSVGLSVCLSVCLFVCGQHYSKSYERFGMKFYCGVLGSTMKNWLNFGGDLCIQR